MSDQGDRSAFRARLASRPPPAPEVVEPGAEAGKDPFADLAVVESREYADPRMRQRGKPLVARVAGPTARAADALLRRWGALALDALRRWGALALDALRRWGALALARLRGAWPSASAWRAARTRLGDAVRRAARESRARGVEWLAGAWTHRRVLVIVASSLFALAFVVDALRVGAPRAWNALVVAGVEVRGIAEELGLVEGAPLAPPAEASVPAAPRRYVLAVATRPPGASVVVEGATFHTPGEIEVVQPEPDLRVQVRKAGHRPFIGRVTAGDFTRVGDRMRCTLDIVLERAQSTAKSPAASGAVQSAASAQPSGPTPLGVRPEPEAIPTTTDRVVPSDPF